MKTPLSTTPTPGPWRLEERPMSGRQIYGPDTMNGGELIVAEVGGHPARQHEANARLIAATPELLDTVKALVKHMLTNNIDGGQAIFDAGCLLDSLGVPRDFYRTEDQQPC